MYDIRIVEGWADVNGARIYYERIGAGDPTLVLIHTGATDARMWDGQFEELARYHAVLRYDLRGFGRSTLPPGRFFMPDDLRALIEVAGVRDPVLVGASVGGRAAIEFAVAHPGLLRGLVVAAPVLRALPTSPIVVEARRREDEALAAGDVEAAVRAVLDTWLIGPYRERGSVDAALEERIATMQRRSFHLQVIDYREPEPWGPETELTPPAKDRLGEIAVPTLAVVGDQDVPDAIETYRLLATHVPRVDARVIPGTAHLLTLERPDEFVGMVREFAAALISASRR